MRAVAGGNAAQPTSALSDLTDATKIEVANAADALVDLSEFAVSLEYDSSADEIVDGAAIVFRRLEGVNSLAPLMTASPPVALGRRIVISVDCGSGTHKEVFRGKIDDVDWPERFGDVTVQCRDQAGVAADTWIETARPYGSTAGVSLELVMQAVADDNLTAPPTLYFPVPTGAVVQHLAGDPPYGPTEQYTLDAERALAESIGATTRWRNFDATPSDWRWTVALPERSKTIADHTFGTSDYWDVTTMKQSLEDIRNVIEVEWMEDGVRNRIVVSDAPSIAKYGRRYAKLSEGSDSPINNLTMATALGNAALSDLKEPDALLEITGRYFWPGEIGVDLYTFTANNKHFSTDQKLAAMRFSHRIAVGERPTTKILTRGKPSGGVLMWQKRLKVTSPLALVPEIRVSNFREVARTDTTVTFGWDVAGTITELWLYLSTPAQPVATDPWAVLTGVPTVRLTGATVSYTVSIPDAGLVTYGRLVPIDADVARGQSWDFTVQGAAVSLIQRATQQSISATQIVVRVAVANPIAGGNVTIAYNAGGLTVAPASGQTITAGSVTADLATTGYVDFTITRPAFLSGGGRVTFTASSTDRTADVDAVDVPAQEQDNPGSLVLETSGSDVIINLAGPSTTASWSYAVSTSAMPSDGSADAGTVTNNRVDRITKSTVVPNLGDRYYVKARQWNTAGGTGIGGPYITAEVERQNKAKTKTLRIPHTQFCSRDPATDVARYELAYVTTSTLAQVIFYSWIVVPPGATIVAFRLRGTRDSGDGILDATLYEVTGDTSATSISILSHATTGWSTLSNSISELVGGAAYVVEVIVDSITSVFDNKFGYAEIDYSVPDLETTI